SGTMGNLVSLLSHCGRGDQVILGTHSHIILHEQGGIAALGGLFPQTVPNASDGTLPIEGIEALICAEEDDHVSKTALLCLENTWNGCVLKPDYLRQFGELARKHRLK